MLQNLYEVLIFLREKKGISKRKLCLDIGIPTTTYQQYESGDSVPENIEVIKKIIDFYDLVGLDLDMFLSAYFTSTLTDRQEYILKELKAIRSETVPQLFDPEVLQEGLKGYSPREQKEIMDILNDGDKMRALINFIILNKT